MPAKILIVDDEKNMRRVLSAHLKQQGWEVSEAVDGEHALSHLKDERFHLMISDIKMPKLDGLSLLNQTIKQCPQLPVILITAHGSIETAVSAMKEGAFDFVTKPFDQGELLDVVRKGLATSSRREKKAKLELSRGQKSGIIGESPKILSLLDLIARVADSPSSILIVGETGTGKELVARMLHQNSSRKDQAFIPVNCGAIPEHLLESELFGYERGAFTGAMTSKPGRMELADGGTLFLDEIAELPKMMQVKILRAIQEQTFERVGGLKTIRVNLRIISATHQNLKEEINAGNFREDLFYRLNTVCLQVPPLRDRKEDLPLLIEHLVEKSNIRLNKTVEQVSQEASDVLLKYDYPGNIRELENTIEHGVLLSTGPMLQLEDLPEEIQSASGQSLVSKGSASSLLEEGANLKTRMKSVKGELEQKIILDALKKTGGNVTRAAKNLGLSRKGLQLKMSAYEIERSGI
ncbi:MAG: sigma-54-dependent transcriptional regulator [Nitrospiria bacterium]